MGARNTSALKCGSTESAATRATYGPSVAWSTSCSRSSRPSRSPPYCTRFSHLSLLRFLGTIVPGSGTSFPGPCSRIRIGARAALISSEMPWSLITSSDGSRPHTRHLGSAHVGRGWPASHPLTLARGQRNRPTIKVPVSILYITRAPAGPRVQDFIHSFSIPTCRVQCCSQLPWYERSYHLHSTTYYLLTMLHGKTQRCSPLPQLRS